MNKLAVKKFNREWSMAEILNLRTRFEEITDNFTMIEHGSHIHILKWFKNEGYKSNSLRDGYEEALFIADKILGEVNGPEEITKRFKVQ